MSYRLGLSVGLFLALAGCEGDPVQRSADLSRAVIDIDVPGQPRAESPFCSPASATDRDGQDAGDVPCLKNPPEPFSPTEHPALNRTRRGVDDPDAGVGPAGSSQDADPLWQGRGHHRP